jgi:hypothetical protein
MHAGPRECTMQLNGEEYPTRLKEPLGYLQEREAGFSTEYRCIVLFPLRGPFAVPKPGLEITLDPRKIGPDEVIDFTADDDAVQIDYCPFFQYRVQKGEILVYSSQRGRGEGTIRFDSVDPTLGGRVKGKLVRATLYGYYDSQDGPRRDDTTPRKLELQDFPFDVQLAPSPY